MPSDWFNKELNGPIARQEEVRWDLQGQRGLWEEERQSCQPNTEEVDWAVGRCGDEPCART